MAVKKAKTTSKKAAVKAPAMSLAVKVLGELPALDSKLRAAYRASFTEEQCEAWGERTKAEAVQREAEKWLATMHATLKKGPVSGYSQRRLAWVAELLVAMEDERARQGSEADLDVARGARSSAMKVASRSRSDLLARLRLVAGGREDLAAEISARSGTAKTPQHVRDGLTGLIALGSQWRHDPALLLLADDADLSDARLSAAYDALENLSRTDEASFDVSSGAADSASVNRVEGRLLRELRHAQAAFELARENGQPAPVLVAGPGIRAAFGSGKGGGEKRATPEAAPAPTPSTPAP